MNTENESTKNEVIEKAIEYFGTQKALAKAAGVTQTAVSNWLNGVHKIKPEHATLITRKSNGAISFFALCPEFSDYAKEITNAA